ncbi:hypothetical protein ACP70R_020045 [Stipagrostis hirtigluma subsp. patula]
MPLLICGGASAPCLHRSMARSPAVAPRPRVHLAMARAQRLPGVLLFPPKTQLTISPQRLPAPCIIALPARPSSSKPARRADSGERWDAHRVKPEDVFQNEPRPPVADDLDNGDETREEIKDSGKQQQGARCMAARAQGVSLANDSAASKCYNAVMMLMRVVVLVIMCQCIFEFV